MSKNDKDTATGPVRAGFDLGGTKMLAKIFDADYDTIGKAKKKTHGHRGQEAGLERIVEVLKEALDDAGAKKGDLASIGVGCPGPIDPSKGEIVEAPNLGWSHVPVEKVLREEFECPVTICNDVDAGAYAEYERGAARGTRCSVAIFPGTGIGAGAVIDGQLLQGSRLSCMEIGHIPIHPETSGASEDSATLETEASRLKIAIESARAAYQGKAPHLLEECGTDISQITSGRLAESVAAGDEEIEKIVRRAATLLGCGVATLVHILAPDRIVLGGGLVEAMPELYLETVKASTEAHVLRPYIGTFEIVAAELEDDAGVLGAAAWAARKAGA